MYGVILGVVVVVMLGSSESVFGRSDGRRRGEVDTPEWSTAPPARVTHRNKGDVADIDQRGSVRYNFGMNGRVMKGIITRHREVPVDDEGTGLEQAKEECCFADSY